MDNQNPTAPTEIPPTIQTPAPVVTPLPQVTPVAPAKPSVDVKNTSVSGGKSHTGLYIVLSIIIVLIALIGGAFWYLSNNTQPASPTPANNQLKAQTPTSTSSASTSEDLNKAIDSVSVDPIDTSEIDKDLNKL